MEEGSAVQQGGYLWPDVLVLGTWYRSKDRKQTPYIDFGSYLMNKKWWLEEELNVHMLRFQQVKSIC